MVFVRLFTLRAAVLVTVFCFYCCCTSSRFSYYCFCFPLARPRSLRSGSTKFVYRPHSARRLAHVAISPLRSALEGPKKMVLSVKE